MVKLELKTTPKAFETASYILRMACDALEQDEEVRRKLSITKTDLKAAKNFRTALTKAILESAK